MDVYCQGLTFLRSLEFSILLIGKEGLVLLPVNFHYKNCNYENCAPIGC